MAYTVKPGDSLWAIAQATLGDGSRWPEIQKANSISGTTIHPGQVFNIPGQDTPAPVAAPVANTLSTPAFDVPAPVAAPDPDRSLYQDPSYAAYMRGLGIDQSALAGVRANALSRYQQQYDQAMPGYDTAQRTGAINIDNNAENRGMFQSGERLRQQNELSGSINAQRDAATAAYARNQDAAWAAESRDNAALERQAAIERINAGIRLDNEKLSTVYEGQ
jgi:hypothetical protein